MIPQPVIEASRLFLEPFKESDIQDIFDYASDEEMTKYVHWYAHKTVQDSKTFYDWIISSTNSERGKIFYVFAISSVLNWVVCQEDSIGDVGTCY